MISVSSAYNNIISGGGNYEWRVVNGSNTWTIENLISGTLTTSMFEELSVGNAPSAQLDLTLWDVTPDTSSPLVLQFRATDGASTQSAWYTKGTFFIDTVEASPYSEETKIVAFDSMLKAEVTYMASGSWIPKTDFEVVTEIVGDIGVTIESGTSNLLSGSPVTLSNAPNVGPNGVTDRQMLCLIAAIRGGNFIINPAGELQLILAYQTPQNTAAIGDAVHTFDASPAEVVKRVKVIVDSETYYLAPVQSSEEAWEALGGRCLTVEIPFFGSQAIANSLFASFSNTSYIPYAATGAFADPKYGVGDGLTIKDVTSVIATQTINIDPLASSDISFDCEEALNSLYPFVSPSMRNVYYETTKAQDAASAAQTAASAAQTSANGANYREQLIYISKASGTTSVSANTTWVTNATGNQNVWTTKRPVYNASYPVLFVATQRQTVAQKGGTTCTCTTPVVDQTTTVIDGGHITTGTIDAGVVNVTNINASNISTGTLDASLIETGGIVIGQLDSSTQTAISNGSSAYSRADASRGTCSTAATTAAKAVTSAGFSLATGSAVTVYFSTANTKADAALTLNINSTGAKTIYVAGAATSSTNQLLWVAGSSITFVYDGTYWRVEDAPGTYRGGACSVAAATAAKTSSVTGVVVFKGVKVSIPMTYENTNTSATLNVSSLGAKAIYYGTGTTCPTTSNGYGWIAGQTPTFEFDGAYWRIQSSGTIINGSHIITGSISDATGKNSWNLNTGDFVTAQGTVGGWTINEGSLSSAYTFTQNPGLTYSTFLRSTDVTYADNVVIGIKESYSGTDWWQWQVSAFGVMSFQNYNQNHFLALEGSELRFATTGGVNLFRLHSTDTDCSMSLSGNAEISGTLTVNGTAQFNSSVSVGNASIAASRYVGARTNSGAVYLWSGGNANGDGNRGVYLNAHGTGTEGWLIYADTNNNPIISKGVTLSGVSSIATSSTIYRTTGAPMLYFSRTPNKDGIEKLGGIFTNTIAVNSKNVCDRMYFRQYTYDANGDPLERWEQYRLPAIGQDASTASYEIITTKNISDIPDASATVAGKVSTGAQTFAGQKTFTSTPRIKAGTQYTQLSLIPSDAVSDEYHGLVGLDTGSGSYPTKSQMYFAEKSLKSSDGSSAGYAELYWLPAVTMNRTTTTNYYILTSKSAVTIAQGGTGQTGTTTATSGVVTRSSGATLRTQSIAKWGKVVTITIELTSTSSIAASGAVFQGTIASGYRPAVQAKGFIAADDKNIALDAYVTTGGAVYVYTPTAISGTTTYTATFTYVIA